MESRSGRHERKRQPVDKVEEILCSKIDETTLNPRYNPGRRVQQDVSLFLSLFLPNIREKGKKATYYIISDVIVRLDKRRIVEKIDLKAVSSQSKSRFESCGGERKGVKAESGFSQESNSLPSSRGIGRSSSRNRTKGSSVNGPLDLWREHDLYDKSIRESVWTFCQIDWQLGRIFFVVRYIKERWIDPRSILVSQNFDWRWIINLLWFKISISFSCVRKW